MARRGRGVADRVAAPDGVDDALNGADQPGARTMGAMALQRWVARSPGELAEGGAEGGVAPGQGPYDEEDLDPELTEADKVDFGAVRIPVPRGGQVSVEPEEGRLQAVHVMLPAGRLSVSALAAPRTERLWPDLAAEIDESLREGGATVRSYTGVWGRELHARTGDASSVFVGVDGPRWMLYGVATGPTGSARELDTALRQMLRGTVVVRGRLPYPVRTVLPLTVPEHLAEPAASPVEQVPAARAGEPIRRPPAPPGRPAQGPAEPVVDDTPTEPHGLPRVPPAATNGHGRPRTNGTAEPFAAPPGRGGPRPNGTVEPGAAAGRPARAPERPPARTGQRRVAELLAEAERERAAARAAQVEPTVRATAVPPRAVPPVPPPPVAPAAAPAAARPPRATPPAVRHDDDLPPVRLGDAPRTRDAEVTTVDAQRWSSGLPDSGRFRVAPAETRRPADGSDDWTVPIPVVPASVPPESPESPERPAADLWAGDPWAEEARRAARAARRAERRGARNGSAEPQQNHSAHVRQPVDVPAARVPPPVRQPPVHLADENPSGRHRRPER